MPHPLTVSEMAANSMRTGILPLVAPRIQHLHWYLKVSRYFDRRGETSQRGVQHEPAPDIQHLHAVEGGAGSPSGTVSPNDRCCSSGTIWAALGLSMCQR